MYCSYVPVFKKLVADDKISLKNPLENKEEASKNSKAKKKREKKV